MTNKSIRDYINLIENAQREDVTEGKPGFDGTDAAGRPVDQELVKRQEKYWNQAAKEKKQQELKRSKELRKPGVAEGSTTRGGFGGSTGQAHHEIEWLKNKIETLKPLLTKKPSVARQIKDLERQIRERELAIAYQKEGVAEGSIGMEKLKQDRKAKEEWIKNNPLMKGKNPVEQQAAWAIYSTFHKPNADKKQGAPDEQLEETSPEAIAKINQLTRRP